MTNVKTLKSACLMVLATAMLGACGGGDDSAEKPSAPAAAPVQIDVSNPSSILIRGNTVVNGLAGQMIGSACRVLERASAKQTTNFSIGSGYPEPYEVPAGQNVDFFNSAEVRMFGFEAVKPIKVTTVSDDAFEVNCK